MIGEPLDDDPGLDDGGVEQLVVVAETSRRYFGLFQGDEDETDAEGRFVHVYVDNAAPARDRSVRAVPEVIRPTVESLVRR